MTEQPHRLSEEARSIANEAKERLLKLNDKPELSRPYLVKGFLSKISRGISSKEAASKFSTAIVTSLLGSLEPHPPEQRTYPFSRCSRFGSTLRALRYERNSRPLQVFCYQSLHVAFLI